MITNPQAIEFMNRLALGQRSRSALVLTEWEQEFLASYGRAYRPFQWITDRRVGVIEKLWRRHGAELGFPHPLDSVNNTPKPAAADPTGCEYLVRLDGRQQCCNAPATLQQPGGLRYCGTHGEAAVDGVKRLGKILRLVKISGAAFCLVMALKSCEPAYAQSADKPVGCKASWEQLDEAGHVGAYGVRYDPRQFTCAARRWPFGARLKVTEIHNGRSVVVTVTDRNPPGRFALDLSWAAFGVLDGHALGVAEVKVEALR